MKTRNLFALAMATMAFAACSNDDDQINLGGGEKGELIESIGISFAAPSTTYADNGTKEGEGTENDIYKAFIFAYQAGQEDLMPGDWSVKEVGDGTTAIGTGDTEGKLNNMATFEKVSKGSNVYVLANVPNLTLGELTALAHNGENSEKMIKEFIHDVSKKYLNGLAYKRAGTPTGQYMMAGQAIIPTNPNTPNGSTVVVTVDLYREMAKVGFQAVITGKTSDVANGRVQLKEDDGIVVARVARQLAPFATLDSYFPANAVSTDKDWGFNATGDDYWKIVFDGDNASGFKEEDHAALPVITGEEFNKKEFNEKAQEYRYTWVNDKSNDMLTITRDAATPTGKLLSPYFYVSPNYSADANCVTVISTQATYVGYPVFKDENAQKLFAAAYSKYIVGNESDFKTIISGTQKESDAVETESFKECNFTAVAMGHVNTYFNGTTFTSTDRAAFMKSLDLDEATMTAAVAAITSVSNPTVASDALDYYTGQKLYYRADIANYNANNTASDNITKRNTYYQIEGTITTLGAKSIEDAINSDNINMQVVVKAMPWNWVVNRPNM